MFCKDRFVDKIPYFPIVPAINHITPIIRAEDVVIKEAEIQEDEDIDMALRDLDLKIAILQSEAIELRNEERKKHRLKNI